jgi:hypothetical protein
MLDLLLDRLRDLGARATWGVSYLPPGEPVHWVRALLPEGEEHAVGASYDEAAAALLTVVSPSAR